MTARHRALILLLAMFWQALSLLCPTSIAAKSMEYEHAALHLHSADHHHHHDDGSLHLQAADSSATPHLHADSGIHTPGLPPGSAAQALVASLTGPGAVPAAGIPSPDLDGLLRPPRRTA